jgi:hypothetical protein
MRLLGFFFAMTADINLPQWGLFGVYPIKV